MPYSWKNKLFTQVVIEKEQKKSYKFYKSPNSTSQFKDTWLPFRAVGFIADDLHITKPYKISELKLYNFPLNNISRERNPECFAGFDASFIAHINHYASQIHINDVLPALLQKFGNTECMLISYLIGGGFWQTRSSIQVQAFIYRHYQTQLAELRSIINDEFDRATIDLNQAPINEAISRIDPVSAQNLHATNEYNYTAQALDYSISPDTIVKGFGDLNELRYLNKSLQESSFYNYYSHVFNDMTPQEKTICQNTLQTNLEQFFKQIPSVSLEGNKHEEFLNKYNELLSNNDFYNLVILIENNLDSFLQLQTLESTFPSRLESFKRSQLNLAKACAQNEIRSPHLEARRHGIFANIKYQFSSDAKLNNLERSDSITTTLVIGLIVLAITIILVALAATNTLEVIPTLMIAAMACMTSIAGIGSSILIATYDIEDAKKEHVKITSVVNAETTNRDLAQNDLIAKHQAMQALTFKL